NPAASSENETQAGLHEHVNRLADIASGSKYPPPPQELGTWHPLDAVIARHRVAATAGGPAMIIATDWRPLKTNTSHGFQMPKVVPSGIVVRECSLHEKDGKRWIRVPCKPQIDSKGRHRREPVTGKPANTPVVEILSKAERERFQKVALPAVDKLLGMTTSPNGAPDSRH